MGFSERGSFMTNRITWIAVITGVVALSGCGGGGGGDDTPVAPAAITTTNATTIASAVMGASLDGGDLGSFASFGTTAGPLAAPKTARILSAVTETQNAQVGALLKRAQSAPQAAIPPETTPCTNGGTVALSGNIGSQGTLSPNDTIVFDFASCVEGDATVDGRFSMQVTSFSGDLGGTFMLGVNVTLSSFKVTVGNAAATVVGSIAISISAVGASSVSTTVTSSSISVTEGGATHTLSHYSSSRTLASGLFSLDVSGTLTSTNFAGSVTFDTATRLQGTDGSFAFAGQIVITGANGATIKVTALDGTFVRLEVDTNGDGVVDATADVHWTDLT